MPNAVSRSPSQSRPGEMPGSEAFRLLVEHSVDVVMLVGPDGRLRYASRAAADVLGYDPGENIGRLLFEFVHPDDAPRARALFGRILSHAGEAVHAELRVRHQDGRWRDLDVTGVNRLDEPELGAVVVTYRDATERTRALEALRLSEERFARVFHSGAAAIALTSISTGHIVDANQRLAELFGYPRDELLGHTTLELGLWADPGDRSGVIRGLRDRGSVHAAETRFRRKAGDEFPALISMELVQFAGDREPTILSLITDISELKQLEEQLRQAQKLEAIGRLAGGVAHDFNNILTAITGYADLVLMQLEDADTKRGDLLEIRAAAQRAAGLTKQLLAFSRRQLLAPRPLSLAVTVSHLEPMLRRLIGEDVQLVTTLAPAAGTIEADPGQIEQVILNLAVNARDAMPNGGRLGIEVTPVTLDQPYRHPQFAVPAGRYTMLAVTDDGIGMTADVKAHLFEPFFTTKEMGKGTGLGLATVYGIVKQSGGFIWVYSEPGTGTTFKMYFPRVDLRAEEPVPAPGSALCAPARAGECVLVVEDEEAVRSLSRRILADAGYHVLTAADPADALALVSQVDRPIHLLLTDVVMPGASGRQLADQLAARQPGLRVLFMSGYTDDAIVQHGVLDSGIDYLAKPFTPDTLTRRVREALDGTT